MRSQHIWLVLVFVRTIAYCNAGESIGSNGVLLSSKIEIKGPAGLVGELTHHGALFGKNFFGESIQKKLYYTKRPLCNGQIPDTPDYIKQGGYFLLVDRGECSFVEKVRNAQRDGATAVLIADNRCLCSESGSCDLVVDEDCEKIEPVMDDDGSGSDIQIPSMLLLKSDADRLRDEIVSGSVIETSISFPVPKATNGRTEYMLFTTPDDRLSHQFLDSFLEAALSLGTKAVFRPRMLLSNGIEKGCRQYDESKVPCEGYCTNYGRYCEAVSIYDTEHYEDKGTKVIVESMRRACIWNLYGKVDGIGKEWWAYVQLWTLQCSFSHYSTSCAESIYDIVGVDKEEVETCMERSGNFREDVLNTMMETSISDIAEYQVKFSPTLVVNGAIINGALNFGNALKAICSTYEDSERPQICDKWDVCSDACSNGETCVLWGDNEECSEYRAPYLSNEGKEFNDDYLTIAFDDETAISEPSNNYMIDSTVMVSKPTVNKDSTYLEDQEGTKNESSPDSPSGISSTAPKSEFSNPSFISDPKQISPTSGELFDTNEIRKKEMYSYDGQHEIFETIEIHEGSNSDLAIGLGVGFGSAIILVLLWLLISKERERRVDDLVLSRRIPRRSSHSNFFKARQRYYDHYSNQSIESAEIDDQFSDEDDYFNDGKVIDHYNSRYRHSQRRERERLFLGKPRHKSRSRLQFEEGIASESSTMRNDQEVPSSPHGSKRSSSIRKKICDEEFPTDSGNDGDLKSRMRFGSLAKNYDYHNDDSNSDRDNKN